MVLNFARKIKLPQTLSQWESVAKAEKIPPPRDNKHQKMSEQERKALHIGEMKIGIEMMAYILHCVGKGQVREVRTATQH